MDLADLMWDNAGRDLDGEAAELARTAAHADAERYLWPVVAQATDEDTLGDRLALLAPRIQMIAHARGYSSTALSDDMRSRWKLLQEAKGVGQRRTAAVVEQEATAVLRANAISRMAARAATENPQLPLADCIELAVAAYEKHLRTQADATPLAYESWGHVADGPFTSEVKNWRPDGNSAPSAPKSGPEADSGEPGAGAGSLIHTPVPTGPAGASARDALELAASLFVGE
jgi:hypothetical protein